MLFWYLFDRISGGSILLGTIFGVCAYNKWWQHFLDQERPFLGHAFAIVYQNIWYRKRLRSVWSRYDQILRVGRRNDMHWIASDRSSSMHQKSAPNSLWKHLYGSIFVRKNWQIFRMRFPMRFMHFFGSGKLFVFFLTKIDPYKCFQSELGADFLCIKELRSLAVQCISFRPSTRNIWS